MYQGKQLARIHIGKKELCLCDDNYEALLFGLTGKSSSKNMNNAERAIVIAKMKEMGAFKAKKLTGQQKACVAKWYDLRKIGAVNSKDKSALNVFVKNNFNKNDVTKLNTTETNRLLGMLEAWIQKEQQKQNGVENDSQIIKSKL